MLLHSPAQPEECMTGSEPDAARVFEPLYVLRAPLEGVGLLESHVVGDGNHPFAPEDGGRFQRGRPLCGSDQHRVDAELVRPCFADAQHIVGVDPASPGEIDYLAFYHSCTS